MEYRTLKIREALPLSRFRPEGGEALLRGMAGATIVRIGSTDEDGIEGGGFLIDYVRAGEKQTRRAVFAFNESGLWPVWEGPIATLETVSR